QMSCCAVTIGIVALHRNPIYNIDAEPGGFGAQSAVKIPVGNHMGEWFTGSDLAAKGQENRANRIAGAGVGNDHFGHGLGICRNGFPDAEALQHAARRGRYRRGAVILLPASLRRSVDDSNVEVRACLLQRNRGGKADIAGARYQNVEFRSMVRHRHSSIHLWKRSPLAQSPPRLLTASVSCPKPCRASERGSSMTAMDELLGILDLERLEHNLFRGRSPKLDWQRVFGGQTIAQALVAAQRTVEPDRHVHSLHGYFM